MIDKPPINVSDPDYDDPIVAEIRQIREQLAAECNYDVATMIRYFEEQRRLHPIDEIFHRNTEHQRSSTGR